MVFGISNSPHIQIDRRETVRSGPDKPKFVLNNTDVDSVYLVDQSKVGAGILMENSDHVIHLSRYRTTEKMLEDYRNELQAELAVLLEEYGQWRSVVIEEKKDRNLELHLDSNEHEIKTGSMTRIIPDYFKRKVFRWAEAYKLYTVVELANRKLAPEKRPMIRNAYLNDVEEFFRYIFGKDQWQLYFDRVRYNIREREIHRYKKKFQRIVYYLNKLPYCNNATEQTEVVQQLNHFFEKFAAGYVTGTFPVNDSDVKKMGQLIDKANRYKGSKIELK